MRSVAMLSLLLAAAVQVALAAPEGDLVAKVPGFNKTSFKVYSGMLNVTGLC